MGNNRMDFGTALGMGLMGGAQNFVNLWEAKKDRELRQKQLDDMAAYRSEQMRMQRDQMDAAQQQRDAANYWDNWDRGAKLASQDASRTMMKGLLGGDIPEYLDPGVGLQIATFRAQQADRAADNARADRALAAQTAGTWSSDGMGNLVNSRTGEVKPMTGAQVDPLLGLTKLDAREVVAKLADGYAAGTLNPQQKALYEVSAASVFGKEQTLPDGSRATTLRPDSIPMPNFAADATRGGMAKPLTAENATKAAAMTEALKSADALESTLIENGDLKNWLLARSAFPLPGDAAAKKVNTDVTFQVEALLRGLSGAGVPETEVQRYRSMLAPGATDTAESFKYKLDKVRGVLRGALDAMGPGAKAADASPSMAPSHSQSVIRYDVQGKRIE